MSSCLRVDEYWNTRARTKKVKRKSKIGDADERIKTRCDGEWKKN